MSEEKIWVNAAKHIQACIDQEKYNDIWKIIYQHTSRVTPDFTLTEETIKDVLVKTLEYYEESLINAEKEISRLNEVIEEKEKMINSLIQTNIHIGTIDNRPPTEQEVCEAYYKCRNTPLVYDKTLKRFTEIKGGRAQGRIIARLRCDNLDIPHILPPHLVEMIGKFYKGKVKE